jgi:hypothetical protein
MRALLALWALPLALFWGWFFLSLNDINFGYVMLSRQLHDLVFELYGEMLGIDPKEIPMLIARACVFDTLLIGAIWAFRARRRLIAWFKDRRDRWFPTAAPAPGDGPKLPAE